jgi:hypothetical protein
VYRLRTACRCAAIRAPATYTPEQICAVVAMTCEKSSESERPTSQWSQREIADEAIRRGLVPNISQRSVGRFLKKADLKLHCIRYWLTPKPDAAFDSKCADICAVYKAAAGADDAHRTISIDEMTGIQALERMAPGLPLVAGKVERREFEYKRRGTQTLIAAFNISAGEVEGVVGNTSTEKDFTRFLRHMLSSAAPTTEWDIVCDNLNIHLSVIRLVARVSGLKLKLGVKGESGVATGSRLASMMSAVSIKLPADTRRVSLLSIARAQTSTFGEARRMEISADVSIIIEVIRVHYKLGLRDRRIGTAP